VDIVLVIEPDSLPNLATNLGDPNCGNSATQTAYKTGIAYAINKFKNLNVTMYLDAAHGGWLGWSDNLIKYV
jgi:cellulose 1,4-beta-cellobiosidase